MQISTNLKTLSAAAPRAVTMTNARALALAALAVVASTNANAGYASSFFRDVGTNHYSSGQDLSNQAYSYEGPSGSVTASATKGPLPSISGSNSAGTPTSHSTTNSLLEVFLQYGFQIHGPSIYVLVPVIISGVYQMDSSGTDYYHGRANVSLSVNGGTGFGFNKYCFDVCSDGGTFAGLVSVYADREITIYEYLSLTAQSWWSNGGIREGAASASAYLDPYISIDPTWARTNPGYSVTVTPGFGNEAPTNSVPEPETYTLLLSGLVLMGAIDRRRKHKNTTV